MKKLILLFGFILVNLFLFRILVASGMRQQVYINEVCSWNSVTITDADSDYADYIELYNASDETVSLDGWYVSDDEDDLTKAQLHGIEMEANGYVLLYANGGTEDPYSLSFRISSSGEKIFLSDPEGNLVDSVAVPELSADTAYARVADGDATWSRMETSPLKSNALSQALKNPVLGAPTFSVQSGFYDNPFYLEIQADPGQTIYYTLDGSEPTEDSAVYTGEIYIEDASGNPNVYSAIQNVTLDWLNYTPSDELVDKAVVVRAVAIDGENTSEIVTATYFVGLAEYEDANVLSIVADPEELFGENGIYVTGSEYDEWYLTDGDEETQPEPNFRKSGEEWEIEGNIELFQEGETEVLNQKVGLRIQGASTRNSAKKKIQYLFQKKI